MKIEKRLPTAAEFNTLRIAVDWGDIPDDYVERALPQSMVSFVALEESDEDTCIGMGRCIGDGIYIFIVDVIIHPDWQRRGVGKRIMDRIMDWYHDDLGGRGILMLMSASGKTGFYEKFGFQPRPDDGPGMMYVRQ